VSEQESAKGAFEVHVRPMCNKCDVVMRDRWIGECSRFVDCLGRDAVEVPIQCPKCGYQSRIHLIFDK